MWRYCIGVLLFGLVLFSAPALPGLPAQNVKDTSPTTKNDSAAKEGQAKGNEAKDDKKVGAKKHTNRLAKETSPYLLMHAHNPTNWYAWGPEAFAKAKKENKLIFLSIGYSSCYWCHVMERESFENEEVAKLFNDSFVCIKVDREERPDIDNIYMTALQQLRQSGGWPLSMFLLPDGRPIVGGTYWPREDRKFEDGKVPGFMTIIKIVRDAYKADPKRVEKQADALAQATVASLQRTAIALVDIDRKLVDETIEALGEAFDPQFGGFGSPARMFRGAKFPLACRLNFLLAAGERTKNDKLINMVTLTLDQMARGGIYDQLGGGFHRYSTERTWTVPHFEKMLYDNAQLLETYAHAYRLTKKPLYKRILRETVAYVQRELRSPAGALYSSQDAETHEEEGRFYVWTDAELAQALPAKADLEFARKVFSAAGEPNFEEKYHILTLRQPLEDYAKDLRLSEKEFLARYEDVRGKLFEARGKRDRPFLNKIALTAWSGQMIAGLAAAGNVLDEPAYIKSAIEAANFVLEHQVTNTGRLLRTYGAAPGEQPRAGVRGYLEDYAFLVHGLLGLHDATGEERWLKQARTLTDTMIEHHGDKRGGFYFTAHDHEKLFARSKDQYDGAQPSSNSIAALNLVRLWDKTGEEKYGDLAHKAFRIFAGSMKTYPEGHTTLAEAIDRYLIVKARQQTAPRPGRAPTSK